MDEDSSRRHGRVTAGASALGATALLVLSFGPSALALSPSTPLPPSARPAISAPAPLPAVSGNAPRSDEGADSTDETDASDS